MSKAYRKFDPTLPELTITSEEKERYFITSRNYTESRSLEPQKLLLCAVEEREHHGLGELQANDHLRETYEQELREIEARLEPDTADLSIPEYYLVSILRDRGYDKGLELYLFRYSKRNWYTHKKNLLDKGIDVNNAANWHEKAKEVEKATAETRKRYIGKKDDVQAARDRCDTWHEEAAHRVLHEKGGRVLVTYLFKGKIYHKAYLQVSRYKITNQGFSGPENDHTLEGLRNIVFYP